MKCWRRSIIKKVLSIVDSNNWPSQTISDNTCKIQNVISEWCWVVVSTVWNILSFASHITSELMDIDVCPVHQLSELWQPLEGKWFSNQLIVRTMVCVVVLSSLLMMMMWTPTSAWPISQTACTFSTRVEMEIVLSSLSVLLEFSSVACDLLSSIQHCLHSEININ